MNAGWDKESVRPRKMRLVVGEGVFIYVSSRLLDACVLSGKVGTVRTLLILQYAAELVKSPSRCNNAQEKI